MSSPSEKQQLWVILLVVFMGSVGTSIAYPIFPPLFLHPALHTIIPSPWDETMRKIGLSVALAAYPLGQFIGTPILGGFSDRYGRKRLLLWCISGSILGYSLTALALIEQWIWVLLFSRWLTGLMEGNLAILRAMASDLESINKYKTLGRIDAMAAMGYVMGPLVGGFFSDNTLVPWFSFALPFFLAMLFSAFTLLLAFIFLTENTPHSSNQLLTLTQRFNFIARIQSVLRTNIQLKYLLIIATIFTFSIDMFYEFGPVYLTGLWSLTPAGIAIYNTVLSIALSLGASQLPHYLSLHFSVRRIVITSILATSIIFGLMALFPNKFFVLLLFGLIGFSTSIVTTNLVIEISHSTHKSILGEVMGSQVSLRMLGDTVICFIGGFLILSSVKMPMIASCLIAASALLVYLFKFRHNTKTHR